LKGYARQCGSGLARENGLIFIIFVA